MQVAKAAFEKVLRRVIQRFFLLDRTSFLSFLWANSWAEAGTGAV